MIGASEWRLVYAFISVFSCFLLLAHDSSFSQVLKCLNQFVQNFPSFTESEFMGKLVISLYMFLLAISEFYFCCFNTNAASLSFHICSYCGATMADICIISESIYSISNWRYRGSLRGQLWFWWCREKPWFLCCSGNTKFTCQKLFVYFIHNNTDRIRSWSLLTGFMSSRVGDLNSW